MEFDPDFDMDFEFDENAPESYLHYLLGDRPVRITMKNGAPILAETIDFEKKRLVIDNLFIGVVAESLDIIRLNEKDFANECLRYGVKPVRD